MLSIGDKIGLICCSNGLPPSMRKELSVLLFSLREMGLLPICSPYIFQDEGGHSAPPRERAKALMQFYKMPSVRAIFDLSGGDLANGILEYLDYESIRQNPKPFFGYSDLTVLLNALYTKGCGPVYYYQIRNLIREKTGSQKLWFSKSLLHHERDLFSYPLTFLQGREMKGVLLGGNTRCFLKLAGTPYFPDLTDAVLFLEARSGQAPQLTSYLTQYRQMGIFQKINGILLGQFTELSKAQGPDAAGRLVREAVQNPSLPIAQTPAFGHSADAKCLSLGTCIYFKKEVFSDEKNNR